MLTLLSVCLARGFAMSYSEFLEAVDLLFREPLECFLAAADEPVVVRFLLPVRLEEFPVRLPARFAGAFAAACQAGQPSPWQARQG